MTSRLSLRKPFRTLRFRGALTQTRARICAVPRLSKSCWRCAARLELEFNESASVRPLRCMAELRAGARECYFQLPRVASLMAFSSPSNHCLVRSGKAQQRATCERMIVRTRRALFASRRPHKRDR